MQRGIRAVKLWQTFLSVGVLLLIDAGVSLIDDAIQAIQCLVQPGIK